MNPRNSDTAQSHAFISYVREDKTQVDQLQQVLEAAGVKVWRDTEDLWPGEDWRIRIRKAITAGSLAFIACFSENTEKRYSSYQNEELILAVEQMRRLPPGRVWFLPVRFSEAELPEFDLGAGRTLDSIQRVDLFGEERDRNLGRLLAAVFAIIGTPEKAGVNSYARPIAETLKAMLLAPEKQIELEDLVSGVSKEVRTAISDEGRYPFDFPIDTTLEVARYVARQADGYVSTLEPATNILVPGCTYGRKEHEVLWTRMVQEITNADKRSSGKTALVNLSRFPALVAVYAAGIAAVHRKNFGALRATASDPIYRDGGEKRPIIDALHPWRAFDGMDVPANILVLEVDGAQVSDDDIIKLGNRQKGRRFTPISDYLHARLRAYFADLIVDDEDYTECFDRFELYFGLIGADVCLQGHLKGRSLATPYAGSFTWRYRYSDYPIERQMLEEIRDAGSSWEPLESGLFGGSAARASEAAEAFAEHAISVRRNRG
ncbi:toll/interleukin-1 receptor domain-containing protein [Actinomadura madurae]|uniref:toll/interleukin-1 receptor domain-containing protein n=1 Tax=Actinomadura madurae TaxID=1993 RepID=UPI000D9B39D6|nr:toll/interleukin-1 receptor domain-containing protein [Actinomadura madurae]SPT59866.1 Uncharacterised protein [Actinomadura madurae]